MKKNIIGKICSVVLAALLVAGSARPGMASWVVETSAGGNVSTYISSPEASLEVVAAKMVVNISSDEVTVSGPEAAGDETGNENNAPGSETEAAEIASNASVSETVADETGSSEAVPGADAGEAESDEAVSEAADDETGSNGAVLEAVADESKANVTVTETSGDEIAVTVNEESVSEADDEEDAGNKPVSEADAGEAGSDEPVLEADGEESANETHVPEIEDAEKTSDASGLKTDGEESENDASAPEADNGEAGNVETEWTDADETGNDFSALQGQAADDNAAGNEEEKAEEADTAPYEVEVDITAAEGLKLIFPDVTLANSEDWVEYSITVKNTGDMTVVLTECQLPQMAESLIVSGAMEKQEAEASGADGELEPGGTCTFTFRVQLPGDYEGGDVTVNGELDYIIEYAIADQNVEIETAPASKYEKRIAKQEGL